MARENAPAPTAAKVFDIPASRIRKWVSRHGEEFGIIKGKWGNRGGRKTRPKTNMAHTDKLHVLPTLNPEPRKSATEAPKVMPTIAEEDRALLRAAFRRTLQGMGNKSGEGWGSSWSPKDLKDAVGALEGIARMVPDVLTFDKRTASEVDTAAEIDLGTDEGRARAVEALGALPASVRRMIAVGE